MKGRFGGRVRLRVDIFPPFAAIFGFTFLHPFLFWACVPPSHPYPFLLVCCYPLFFHLSRPPFPLPADSTRCRCCPSSLISPRTPSTSHSREYSLLHLISSRTAPRFLCGTLYKRVQTSSAEGPLLLHYLSSTIECMSSNSQPLPFHEFYLLKLFAEKKPSKNDVQKCLCAKILSSNKMYS